MKSFCVRECVASLDWESRMKGIQDFCPLQTRKLRSCALLCALLVHASRVLDCHVVAEVQWRYCWNLFLSSRFRRCWPGCSIPRQDSTSCHVPHPSPLFSWWVFSELVCAFANQTSYPPGVHLMHRLVYTTTDPSVRQLGRSHFVVGDQSKK